MAESAYGNIALRQFGDLDVLVNIQDTSRAKEMLTTIGYQPQPTLQLSWEAHFARADGQVGVDLHWDITPWHFTFPIDFTHLWDRRQTVSLAGKKVQTLAPEDTLIIRCQDAARDCFHHDWPKLHWICDVAELAVQESLDWQQVMGRSRQLKSRGVLLFCLSLTKQVLDTSLPDFVLQEIEADPQLKALVKTAQGRLFYETERESYDPQQQYLKIQFFSLRLKELLPLPPSLAYSILNLVASLYYWLPTIRN